MKKLSIILIIILLFSGCNNKYDNFEYYDLTNYKKLTFKYVENFEENIYVLADITPKNYEMKLYGLFYKISDNDYILLDKIENGSLSEQENYFINNKLYVNACNSSCHFEYTLLKDKTTKKELNFDYSSVGKQIRMYYPTKVEDNYIYYYSVMYDSTINLDYWGKEYILKCSLENYKCVDSKDSVKSFMENK